MLCANDNKTTQWGKYSAKLEEGLARVSPGNAVLTSI